MAAKECYIPRYVCDKDGVCEHCTNNYPRRKKFKTKNQIEKELSMKYTKEKDNANKSN